MIPRQVVPGRVRFFLEEEGIHPTGEVRQRIGSNHLVCLTLLLKNEPTARVQRSSIQIDLR